MSIKNSKTANAFSLSDPLTKLQLEKDDLFDLFIEDESELKEGDYEGEVLVAQRVPGTNILKAMIRIDQIHGSQIPVGKCDDGSGATENFSPAQQKLMVYSHTCAISEMPQHLLSDDGEETEVQEFCDNMVSQKVIVTFGQSPNQKGKTRFAKFTYPPNSTSYKSNANGCYTFDCPEGLSGAEWDWSSLLGDSGGSSSTGGGDGASGNPPKNTKLVRRPKNGVKNWPRAFTVTNLRGTDYEDIKKCPYKNMKNLTYFSDTGAPYKTNGETGKYKIKKEKLKNATKLGIAFATLLASKLSFDITITSNTRNAAANGAILANITFEHLQEGTAGLDLYSADRKKRYIKWFKKFKIKSKESNPKKGGKTWKLLQKAIDQEYKNKPPKGHMIGAALDISSRSLTKQQVSDVLYTCYYMGVSWVMLEHHVPHIHVSITKSDKLKSIADCNNEEKIAPFIEGWKKSYEKKRPEKLPKV